MKNKKESGQTKIFGLCYKVSVPIIKLEKPFFVRKVKRNETPSKIRPQPAVLTTGTDQLWTLNKSRKHLKTCTSVFYYLHNSTRILIACLVFV